MKDISKGVSIVFFVGGLCFLVLSQTYQREWYENYHEYNFLKKIEINPLHDQPVAGEMQLFEGEASCEKSEMSPLRDGLISEVEYLAANMSTLTPSLIRSTMLQKRIEDASTSKANEKWIDQQQELNQFTCLSPTIGKNVLMDWKSAIDNFAKVESKQYSVDQQTRYEVRATVMQGQQQTGLGQHHKTEENSTNSELNWHFLDPIVSPNGYNTYLLTPGKHSVDSITSYLQSTQQSSYDQFQQILLVGVLFIVLSIPFAIQGYVF